MDLSFITPVYNTKVEYLNECYDSVIKNCSSITYEIVMVNDGSTLDETKKWLSEHESEKNLRIINLPENAGISVARNIALDAATGDYILTLDSDDYICSESICNVVKMAKNGNLDICFSALFYKNDKMCKRMPARINDKISYYQLESFLTPSRLIRREFINKYHIRYPVGKLCEDSCFNLSCMLYMRKFSAINECFMTIRYHEDSTCHTKSVFHCMKYDKIPFDYIRNALCVSLNNIDKDLLEAYQGGVAHFIASICCVFSSKSAAQEKQKINDEAARIYRNYIKKPIRTSLKYAINHNGRYATRFMQFGFALSICFNIERFYIWLWSKIIKE